MENQINSKIMELCESAAQRHLHPGDLIIEIGRFFLGAPYQSGVLEVAGREKLVINLEAFDCMTFVETVLALVRCASAEKLSPVELRRNLQLIRYRQGTIDGYASRLHYFIDWLDDNQQKRTLQDLTRLFSGKLHRKKINYITAHRELYVGLSNQNQLDEMLLLEKKLSRKVFYIIGGKQATKTLGGIEHGDIIAFAVSEQGLDVAHVGFALRSGRSVHLLHASSREGAVVVSSETLPAYLKSHRKFTGIIVARYCSPEIIAKNQPVID